MASSPTLSSHFTDSSSITHQERFVTAESEDFETAERNFQSQLKQALVGVNADDIVSLSTTHTVACDTAGVVTRHFRSATVIIRYRRKRH